MQKEPKERLQDAKSVYNALHNQMDHQLLGADKAIQGVKDWTQRHQTSLVLVHGHQGMGTRACFKHLIEHHQQLGWAIYLGYKTPPVSMQPKLLVLSGSLDNVSPAFISEVQQRTVNNEPLTILINTVDKWQYFGQELLIPKKAFALEPLSPTQIQQLLQPFGLSREGLAIISTRLYELYKGRIEYIQEVLQEQWVYSLRTIPTHELEKINIPSSPSCQRHQEFLFKSVSKPVLPVLTALLIFDGPITTSNLCKLMKASSDHIGHSFDG